MNRMYRISILATFLIPACAALAAAQPPSLVADLNTEAFNGSAFPPSYDYWHQRMAELKGLVYFAATDPAHGQELWRSDGTPEGTRLVRDIQPGPVGSNLQSLTVHRGRLYFFADDGVWGPELWSSDGTREGTRLVRDTCPGFCPVFHPSFLASAGDRLYFTTGNYFNRELWRTDGTREGTRRVVDTCSGCFSFLDRGLTGLPNGRVLFAASHPEKGVELWLSDGTPAGTLALDLAPGAPGSYPTHLTALGERVLFWIQEGDSFSLWISDGTPAGTRAVRRSFAPPGFDSEPVAWQGSLYFANEAGELWRTNGTSGGTRRLRTFETGPTPFSAPYRPTRLTPLPDRLLFIAGDSTRGMALWETRGTQETTRLLKDPAPGLIDLSGLHRVGSRAFFLTRRVEGPIHLWTSDGTAQGTRRVATVCHDVNGCYSTDRRDFLGVGGLSFFIAHSPVVGRELWRSDGSAAGTFRVRDIHRDPGSAVVREIAALDGRAFFGALTIAANLGPAALWSSDGTAGGTAPVRDDAAWPQDFIRQGDHLFFSGGGPWYPGEPLFLRRQGLWRTDGTPAGTGLLAGDLYDLDLLALDGDVLYLGARDTDATHLGTGIELWRSDGTPEGTRQVADINQQWEANAVTSPPILEPGSSEPGPLVRLGPVLLFAADDGLSGRELWATDGTEAGTRQVLNINQQDLHDSGFVPGESYPDNLVRLGGVVLFAADDGRYGRELWVTDGTAAGTRLLLDLRHGGQSSSPHDFVVHGGLVYFFAATGNGEALWRTDGTEGGTLPILSLARRDLPSRGRALTLAGGRLFFVVDNEATGPELHVSDGTAAGTRLVQIRPGPNGSYPQSLAAVDGILVFAADDGAHGLEPWRSDGTEAGTYPLGDLAPGPAASSPSAFTAAGGLLFFGADDGVHGRELWSVGWPR